MSFQLVPEAKAVKNRVHLDVDVDDLGALPKLRSVVGGRRIGDVVYDELAAFR